MTTLTTNSRYTGKGGIGRILGLLFVALCVFAIVLNVGLPYGSSAATAPIVFGPDVDASVAQASPTTATPTSSQLAAVGGSSQRQSFIRFTVGGLSADAVVQAVKLRLVVTNDSTGKTIFSGLKNNSWPENITWNTKPAIDGPQVSQLGPVAVGQVVELDLTSAIRGPGTYSFAITSDPANTNTVAYASRDNSTTANRPQLLVTLQSGTANSQPVPTSTATGPTATAPSNPTPTATAPSNPTPTATVPAPTSSTILVQPSTGGYLGSTVELGQRKQLASQGMEPYKSAASNAINFANGKLSSSPSPQQPLDISGTTGPFVDDTATAYGLALAYSITGDLKYAQKSREFIMAWVQTTTSTSNTCTDSGSCQTSLIIGRVAPGFVFAANLIKPSGALTSTDDQAFRNWLRTVILPTASERINNWGDAGTFMRAAVTDYINDSAGFSAAIAKWKSLVDLIASDGHIPEETRRGSSGLNYTQEALDYKIGVAVIAQRRGINLWDYGRFKLAVDYAAKYVVDPGSWPWASGASATIHPLWEIAYQHWRSPAYVPIIKMRRPYGSEGHSALRWVTLSNGIPF